MAIELLPYREEIRRLKEEFKAHPEKYPDQPGHTYRIVVYKSDDTALRKSEVNNPVARRNSFLRIMAVPDGLEKHIVTVHKLER